MGVSREIRCTLLNVPSALLDDIYISLLSFCLCSMWKLQHSLNQHSLSPHRYSWTGSWTGCELHMRVIHEALSMLTIVFSITARTDLRGGEKASFRSRYPPFLVFLFLCGLLLPYTCWYADALLSFFQALRTTLCTRRRWWSQLKSGSLDRLTLHYFPLLFLFNLPCLQLTFFF